METNPNDNIALVCKIYICVKEVANIYNFRIRILNCLYMITDTRSQVVLIKQLRLLKRDCGLVGGHYVLASCDMMINDNSRLPNVVKRSI